MVMDYYVPGGTAATPVDWSTIDAQALTPYEQYRSQALGQLGGMGRYAMGLPTRGILGQLARSGLIGQLGRYNTLRATPGEDWFGRPEGGFAGWLGGQLPVGETGYVPIPIGGAGYG